MGDFLAPIIVFVMWLTLTVGWVMNLFKIFGENNETLEVVVRIIGLFIAPVGSLLGLFMG